MSSPSLTMASRQRAPVLYLLSAYTGAILWQHYTLPIASPRYLLIPLALLILSHKHTRLVLLWLLFFLLSQQYLQHIHPIPNTAPSSFTHPRSSPFRLQLISIHPHPHWSQSSGLAYAYDLSLPSPQNPQKVYYRLDHPRSTRLTSPSTLLITGTIQGVSPEQNSPWQQYLQQQQVTATLHDIRIQQILQQPLLHRHSLSPLRHQIKQALRTPALITHIHPSASAIPPAIFLGDKSSLTRPQKQLFQHTGTMHLFAVSGLHIGILAGLTYACLRLSPLRKSIQRLITLGLLASYIALIGSPPSALRAYTMLALFLLCFSIRRKKEFTPILSLTALLTLLLEPRQLFLPGWQLSYAAVLSLFAWGIPLSQILQQKLHRPQQHPWHVQAQNYLITSLCISLSICLLTAPILQYHFGHHSFGAIALNLLLIPLTTLVIACACLSVLSTSIGLTLLTSLSNTAALLLSRSMELLCQHTQALIPLHNESQTHIPLSTTLIALGLIGLSTVTSYQGHKKQKALLALPLLSWFVYRLII